jgi:hypothetical protein
MTEQRLNARRRTVAYYVEPCARNIVIQASKSILLQCNKLNYGLIFSSSREVVMAEPLPIVLIPGLNCSARPYAEQSRRCGDSGRSRSSTIRAIRTWMRLRHASKLAHRVRRIYDRRLGYLRMKAVLRCLRSGSFAAALLGPREMFDLGPQRGRTLIRVAVTDRVL